MKRLTLLAVVVILLAAGLLVKSGPVAAHKDIALQSCTLEAPYGMSVLRFEDGTCYLGSGGE